ncbi:transcriptional regulator [Clostridium perfringens]|uniref:transcriptional regulator n=1 Tax=Clostridium perfringens TaxID=1502 RepID=UPI001241A1E5|nr:transcriptional regulator [Clostridium perfringens]MDU2085987.1 transcriptional regulator [Clostridium perfringens]MDU8977384.1 transcriptional regulator [Clostridium perfringens]
MDKTLFKKTEGALYRYFKYKKKIYRLKERVRYLENRLIGIEEDIKNANVTIDYYQNGTGISERVQTSSNGISFAESQICKEIGKLEREHITITKKIFRIKADIRYLNDFVEDMDLNLKTLNEEDRRYIELKYGDGKSPIAISRSLNIAQATAYRKREEVIEKVADYKNTLMFIGKKTKNDKKMIKC